MSTENGLDVIMETFGMGVYLPLLGEETFATEVISLSLNEAQAFLNRASRFEIVGGVMRLKDDAQEESAEDRVLLQSLCGRIDECIGGRFQGASFVKLSSRSPKDSVFDMRSDRTAALLQEELDTVHWNSVDASLWDDAEVACFMRAAGLAMMSRNSDDTMRLFLESARIVVDLKRAVKRQQRFNVSIVCRAWTPVPLWSEFRGFVCQGTLTALSQYFHFLYFRQLSERKEQIVQEIADYFNGVIRDRLSSTYDSYVIDFSWNPEDEEKPLWVIELNPWGKRTGASLFDWAADEQLLHDTDAKLPVLKLVERPDPQVKLRALVPYWERWLGEYREKRLAGDAKCDLF